MGIRPQWTTSHTHTATRHCDFGELGEFGVLSTNDRVSTQLSCPLSALRLRGEFRSLDDVTSPPDDDGHHRIRLSQ